MDSSEATAAEESADPQPCSSSSCISSTSASEAIPMDEVDEEEVFEFKGSPHPLLLPTIVREVMDYVREEELKSCRLVCSTWNEEVCKIQHHKTKITFLDGEAISRYMDCFAPGPMLVSHSKFEFYNIGLRGNGPLEQFMQQYGRNIKTLILQLTLISEADLNRFLENYLPNLESLWLRNVPLGDLPPDRIPPIHALFHQEIAPLLDSRMNFGPEDASRIFVNQFPSIRHFTIGSPSLSTENPEFIDDTSTWTWGRKPNLLIKLLKCMPHLQTVSLSTLDAPYHRGFSASVLRCLVEAGAPTLHNLRLINFPMEFWSNPLPQQLTSLQLIHLMSLEITVHIRVDPATLMSFLASIGGESLTKLTLSLHANYPFGYNFSALRRELHRLRHLSLKNFKESLDFIENLSALKSLLLCDVNLSSSFPRRFRTHNGLEELKITTGERGILLTSPEAMTRITLAFPNLKVLHVPGVNDECLLSIYMNLPFLKELRCTESTMTDSGISGVPLEICTDCVQTQTFYAGYDDKYRNSLFIGNLTNLERLHLESNSITDLAAMFGIIKCPSLKSLLLKSTEISDLAVECITNQMGNFLQCLNVLECPGVTEGGNFFANERYPGKHFLAKPALANPVNEEAKARIRHRFCDSVYRRAGLRKFQEVKALLLQCRRAGRNNRALQIRIIQERIDQLSRQLPPNQIYELRRELIRIQRDYNE